MTNILTKAVMSLWGVAPDQPFIGDEPLSGMDIGAITPGNYLTRGGRRVEYLGAGEGRFLPYGLRTGGWLPASGRWLSSEADHDYDLIERVSDGL